MAYRRSVSFAALFAVLGGIVFLAAISWKGAVPRGSLEPVGGGTAAGPQVILKKVEMREVGKGGTQYRLSSEEAVYRISDRALSATGVRLAVPDAAGEMVVRASKASWDLRTGQVFLPDGASAENASGWSAVVSAANLSLGERLLRAPGQARITGPGLSVAGDALVWRWKEGKMTLEMPKTRLEPARAFGKKG